MISKKRSAKDGTVRVTFEVPGEQVEDKAAVVGSFNDWDPKADPMKYVKSRDVWKKEVKLEADQEVEFRYYVDGGKWYNEEQADRQVGNEYGGQNSVIQL